MSELWLKFRDESGYDQRVPVDREKFVIGRDPGNNLTIPNTRLSRQHLKIDRFGDVFVASDSGSSNGTQLNGSALTEPVSLKDGDRLNLGGAVEIDVEIIAKQTETRRARRASSENTDGGSAGSSIPTAVYFAAPALVLLILLCGGGILVALNGGKPSEVSQNDNPIIFETPEDTDEDSPKSPTPTPTVSPTGSSDNTTPAPTATGTTPAPTVQVSDEAKKIERHSAGFMQKIALTDTTAFLNTAQIEIVKSRLGSLKGSSALAENLKAVKRDAAQFESLAGGQGLKPQFLAAAALTKLGNKTGDPLAAAKEMLPLLADLRISLGNSLADDNLLIMADYLRRERKAKGATKERSLQSILEGVPFSEEGKKADPREIRTIWFLHRTKKIKDDAFEFALRFLAIGTIMQNPKDFNVNAEPTIF